MEKPTYKLYGIAGSEFNSKIASVLDWLGLPFQMFQVPLAAKARRKILPRPYLMPVLQTPGGLTLVDTHDILVWLNEHEEQARGKLFPVGQEEEVTKVEMASEIVYAHSQYLAFCCRENFDQLRIYERAMDALPWFIGCVVTRATAFRVASKRGEEVINKITDGTSFSFTFPPDPSTDYVHDLRRDLAPFEARLGQGRTFLCSSDTPTAADFGLFGMLCKLCGPSAWGTADKSYIGSVYPSATALMGPELPNLIEWHATIARLAPSRTDFSGLDSELVSTGAVIFYDGPKLPDPINAFDTEKHGKRKLQVLSALQL